MTFATNADLVKYYASALEHGVSDWTDELQQAEDDIKLVVKTKWFNLEFGSQRNRSTVTAPVFDGERLTATQWRQAACYRALSAYILPKLSTFRPEGDAFQQALTFFNQRYNEEMNLQLTSGVEYDINNDGNVTDVEKFPTYTNRLYR
jgi:hypothetical protein